MKTIKLPDDLDEHGFFAVPFMFVPLGGANVKNFFTMKDMLSEHWQLLAKCIKKDMNPVPKLIKDLAVLDDVGNLKTYCFLFMRYVMEKRLETPIRIVEQGYNTLENWRTD